MKGSNRAPSFLYLRFYTSLSFRATYASRFREAWLAKQSYLWLQHDPCNHVSVTMGNLHRSMRRTGTARISRGWPLCSRSCRSHGLRGIGRYASISVGTVTQLKACVSRFIGYQNNRQTRLVFIVVAGNFNDHRCRAEDVIVAEVTEEDFTVR